MGLNVVARGGVRDRQAFWVGPLAWSRISRSPGAPASFPANREELALGQALAARVGDVTRMAADAAAATGLLELATNRFVKPIHDVHTLTTRVIARFLITGQGTTERERSFIAGFGVLAALYRLPFATLAASFLLWRDANLRVLNEEVKRLGTTVEVSEEARKIIRSIADTGMVGMALAYDHQVLAKQRR